MYPSVSGNELACRRQSLSNATQVHVQQHALNRSIHFTVAPQSATLRLSRHLDLRMRRRVSTRSLRGARALQVRAVTGEVVDVEELEGVRVILQNNRPVAQFLVKWKDGKPSTW